MSTRPKEMTYPFPIRREGKVFHYLLSLPVDLTMDEAERLGQLLKTLAVEEEKS